MLRSLTAVACVILAAIAPACRRKPDPASASPLRFETRKFERDLPGCGDPAKRPEPCVTFHVVWPEVTAAPGEEARRRINAAVLAALQPKEAPRGFEPEADQWIADFRRFHAEFPDSGITYFARRTAAVIFANASLASIEIQTDEFRGGPHPESRREYLNVSPSSGQTVLLEDLLEARAAAAFLPAVERRFRGARRIPADQTLSAAGYTFEQDRFSLPRQWGVTTQGLVFHFNAGEIAPQESGATTFTVPWAELQGLIRPQAGILPLS